jgi:DNA-directed RNA polymerase subunit RPC12/RpoP
MGKPADQLNPNRDAGAPIVFCPQCKTRVLSLKSVKISAFRLSAAVEYVCADCGFETIERSS